MDNIVGAATFLEKARRDLVSDIFLERDVSTPLPVMDIVRRATPGRAENLALGKAARANASRSGHGEWKPAPNRPDPIALLQLQAATRFSYLRSLRCGRMSASPFAFLPGFETMMAQVPAILPVSGIRAQICGDAHPTNENTTVMMAVVMPLFRRSALAQRDTQYQKSSDVFLTQKESTG